MRFQWPIYQTRFGTSEAKLAQECIESGWISWRGKFVSEFEEKFAAYVGCEHAIAVSSGTAALHLALLALGVGQESRVIVPDLAYVAVANVVSYVGAELIFVDCNVIDWNIQVELVEKEVTKRTAAIIVVHTLGHPCQMDKLKVMIPPEVPIIEDACEALGARRGRQHVGTFGKIGCFSFFANKAITTGEGGVLVTDDADIAEHVRKLRGQGQVPGKSYWHDEIGYNYRMTNLQAAVGVAQMGRLNAILEEKWRVVGKYKECLATEKRATFQSCSSLNTHAYWMVGIMFNRAASEIASKLAEDGIETRPMFYPISSLPMYEDMGGVSSRPTARFCAKHILMLPSHPNLSDEDVEHICDCIRKTLDKLDEQRR